MAEPKDLGRLVASESSSVVLSTEDAAKVPALVDGRVPVDASGVPVPVTDNGGSITVDGSVAVSGVGGTVTVSGSVAVTSSALPTGAATETTLASIDAKTPGVPSLVAYSFSTGNLTTSVTADGATAGRAWIINPLASTKFLVIAEAVISQAIPDPSVALSSIPRVTIERMSFTGGASSATVQTSLKSVTADPVPTGLCVLATTGLSGVTAGARWFDSYPPSTGVGGILSNRFGTTEPIGERRVPKAPIVLIGGEGIVVRQADSGTSGDTRQFSVVITWCEVDTLTEARAFIRARAMSG